MQKLIAYLSKNIAYLIVLSYFVLEFFSTAYFYFISYKSIRLIGFFKLIILFCLLLSIKIKFIHKRILYACGLLCLFFSINQFVYNPIFEGNLGYHISKGSFYYLIRFLTIFIFIVSFQTWASKGKIAIHLTSIIEKVLVLNGVFVIIGFFFQIKLFKSYYFESLRFGYDGWFNKVNEVSYFYIIFIMILYYRFIMTKKQLPLLIYVICISLLLGTKTVLLFLGLLSLFHFLVIVKNAKIYRVLIVLPLTFFVVFFKEIIQYVFNLFPFWRVLSEQYSIQTMLFSTRNLTVYRLLAYFDDMWVNLNYLIGGSYYTENFHRSEMDLFDLFVFFGFFGAIIYLYLLVVYFFEKKNGLRNILVSFVFVAGFLGGGLLLSMLAIIYLYLSSLSMNIKRT